MEFNVQSVMRRSGLPIVTTSITVNAVTVSLMVGSGISGSVGDLVARTTTAPMRNFQWTGRRQSSSEFPSRIGWIVIVHREERLGIYFPTDMNAVNI